MKKFFEKPKIKISIILITAIVVSAAFLYMIRRIAQNNPSSDSFEQVNQSKADSVVRETDSIDKADKNFPPSND